MQIDGIGVQGGINPDAKKPSLLHQEDNTALNLTGNNTQSLDELYAAVLKQYGFDMPDTSKDMIVSGSKIPEIPENETAENGQETTQPRSAYKGISPSKLVMTSPDIKDPVLTQKPRTVPKTPDSALTRKPGSASPDSVSASISHSSSANNMYPKTIQIMKENMENPADFENITKELLREAAEKGLNDDETNSWINASLLVKLSPLQKPNTIAAGYNNQTLSRFVSNITIPNGSEQYKKMMDGIMESLKPPIKDIVQTISAAAKQVIPPKEETADAAADIDAAEKPVIEENQEGKTQREIEQEEHEKNTPFMIPTARIVRQKKS